MKIKENILFLIIIILIIILIWALFKLKKNPYNQKDYYDDIYKYAQTIDQKNVLIEDITQAALKSDSLRTSYEKELVYAKNEIESLNLKLKNVKSFTHFTNTLIDTIVIKLTDTLFLNQQEGKFGFYSDGYVWGEYFYFPLTDSLSINYTIIDSLVIVDSWIRKPNKKGEQSFILWRWLKPWQLKCDIKSKNPKSVISNGNRLFIKKK